MMETAVNVNGFPEPDVTILNKDRSALDGYAKHTDITAVIEVCHATLKADVEVKIPKCVKGALGSVFVVTERDVQHFGTTDLEPTGIRQLIVSAVGSEFGD